MSISFMALAWKAAIPSGRKLVLLSLCDHANGQGECYPSVEAIARKCGMGQRTVQQHISELESAGILERRFRRGRSTLYKLDLRKFCIPAEFAGPQDAAANYANTAALPPQLSHFAPADPAPISIIEPPLKPSSNQQLMHGTRLPTTWAMPKSWEEWALQEQPTWTAAHARSVADKFRDHWTALPGQRGVKADWLATWRNWCRNEKPIAQNINVMRGAWQTSRFAGDANDTALRLNPLPGESVATFNARLMQHLEKASRQTPYPASLEASSQDLPTKYTISPANRAAALEAARALKSRLYK